MLTLPIKKQWLDMICCGEKKEEYRNITPRYTTIFSDAVKNGTTMQVRLRNGYKRTSPPIIITCKCHIGKGLEKWGAEPNTDYFVLSILSYELE